MKRAIAAVAVTLLTPAPALAAGTAAKDHEFSCYCEAEKTPESILALDDNWEIVDACKAPKTRKELGALFPRLTDSQLELLVDFRVLALEKGTYRTAFPVLDAKATGELRRSMRELAPAVLDGVRPELDGFLAILGKAGRARNAFSVLFAYVMDGQVWRRLEEKGLLHKQTLTPETPFWAGTIWASAPRAFSCGTNSLQAEDATLMINWSRAAHGKMGPLMSDWKSVAALATWLGKGGALDPRVRQVFEPAGLFDASGQLAVPVVTERPGDPLFDAASRLSQKLAGAVATKLPLAELSRRFGLGSSEAALVIAYHELMWEMLAELDAKGIVKKPITFANPEQAKPSDAADLVVVVRAPPPAK